MLQTSTDVMSDSTEIKSYQPVLLNNLSKRNKISEDGFTRKERIMPNMQQVIHTDLERMKTNKIYDRKLNQDLNGPKGLNWRCKYELQRLRDDERLIERDLIRLKRDLGKTTVLPAINNRSSSSIRNHSIRLSVIAEERSSISIYDQPKVPIERTVSIHSPRIPSKNLVPLLKRSMLMKTNSLPDSSYVSPKQTFQQLIAKTSDDRIHHQQKKFKQTLH